MISKLFQSNIILIIYLQDKSKTFKLAPNQLIIGAFVQVKLKFQIFTSP